MDRIIQWNRVKLIKDEILKNIEDLLKNKNQLDSEVLEHINEIKAFLSNEVRLKESLENEGLYHFLMTAKTVVEMAKEEFEKSQNDKEIE